MLTLSFAALFALYGNRYLVLILPAALIALAVMLWVWSLPDA